MRTPLYSFIQSVAKGNGLYLAAASGEMVMRSSDFQTWTNTFVATNSALRCLTFGKGEFVGWGIVGATSLPRSAPFVSEDGLNWRRGPILLGMINGVELLNDLFVAYGFDGLVLTSDDGENWQQQATASGESFSGAAFGNGLFILTGNRGADEILLVSTDGRTWARQSPPSGRIFLDVAFGNGLFAAVAAYAGNAENIFTSSDGIAWTAVATPFSGSNSFQAIEHGNGMFVAVGNRGLMAYSTDGVAWKQQPSPVSERIESVTFQDGEFLAIWSQQTFGILKSTSGTNWIKIPELNAVRNVRACRRLNSIYLAAGENRVIGTSEDAIRWSKAHGPGAGTLFDVGFGNGVYVAAGGSDDKGLFLSSTNLVDWQAAEGGAGETIKGLAFGNGRFVAVGGNSFSNGVIYLSANGVDWRKVWTHGAGSLEAILRLNDGFLCAGNQGAMLRSNDGENWTSVETGSAAPQAGIDFFNGKLIAWGRDAILISTNGSSWTRVAPPAPLLWLAPARKNLYLVTENHDLFESSDGTAWRELTGSRTPGARLLYTGSYFISFGPSVYTSDLFPVPPRFNAPVRWVRTQNGAGLQMEIAAEPDSAFTLETSPDLRNWRPLQVFDNAPGLIDFTDLTSPEEKMKFYRATRNDR